jgi:hypothetical protein
MDLPKKVDPRNPRAFRHAVHTNISNNDVQDLARVTRRVGADQLIRYLAAQYMDPMFQTEEVATIYKLFGETVEAAYQGMVAALEGIEERKRAEKARAVDKSIGALIALELVGHEDIETRVAVLKRHAVPALHDFARYIGAPGLTERFRSQREYSHDDYATDLAAEYARQSDVKAC